MHVYQWREAMVFRHGDDDGVAVLVGFKRQVVMRLPSALQGDSRHTDGEQDTVGQDVSLSATRTGKALPSHSWHQRTDMASIDRATLYGQSSPAGVSISACDYNLARVGGRAIQSRGVTVSLLVNRSPTSFRSS
ncbi:MAG: hypothetical protein EOO77_01350 [Oxalobacteraceae bacterium]|nr:MAG: hypothetical protein EOO77_01350 [Oxalobacteraceae bacterium]